MNQDIRTIGELDQVLRRPRVARDHDRTVGSIEAICKRRSDRRVIDERRRYANVIVLEHQAAVCQLVHIDQRLERHATFVLDPRADVVGVHG